MVVLFKPRKIRKHFKSPGKLVWAEGVLITSTGTKVISGNVNGKFKAFITELKKKEQMVVNVEASGNYYWINPAKKNPKEMGI